MTIEQPNPDEGNERTQSPTDEIPCPKSVKVAAGLGVVLGGLALLGVAAFVALAWPAFQRPFGAGGFGRFGSVIIVVALLFPVWIGIGFVRIGLGAIRGKVPDILRYSIF